VSIESDNAEITRSLTNMILVVFALIALVVLACVMP